MNLKIEIEQEEDGRFIAEVIDFPGVLAYGNTRQEAVGGDTTFENLCLACRSCNEYKSNLQRFPII